MKIFGCRIIADSVYRKMQADLDGVVGKVKETEKENKNLKSELDAIKNGKRCSGGYCKSCESYGGTQPSYVGWGIVDQVPVCLKEVPCPEFVRKDEMQRRMMADA